MVAKRVKIVRRRANNEVAGLLETLADTVVKAAKSGEDPRIDIPVRSLSNVEFSKKNRIIEMGKSKTARQFFNLGMAKKFMQTMLVADKLMELQRQDNLSTSLREVFYRAKHTIEGTSENRRWVNEPEPSQKVRSWSVPTNGELGLPRTVSWPSRSHSDIIKSMSAVSFARWNVAWSS